MLAQARHESDLLCDTTIAQKYDTSIHQKAEFVIQMQNTINKLDEKLGTDWKSN